MGGGALGAAVGVLPALFTFGLSIPCGAMIGSGAGLCLGTLVGGTAGVAAGGAAGHVAYEKRAEIRNGATGSAAYIKAKVGAARGFVDAKITSRGKQNVANDNQGASSPKR